MTEQETKLTTTFGKLTTAYRDFGTNFAGAKMTDDQLDRRVKDDTEKSANGHKEKIPDDFSKVCDAQREAINNSHLNGMFTVTRHQLQSEDPILDEVMFDTKGNALPIEQALAKFDEMTGKGAEYLRLATQGQMADVLSAPDTAVTSGHREAAQKRLTTFTEGRNIIREYIQIAQQKAREQAKRPVA